MSPFNRWAYRYPIGFGTVMAAILLAPWVIAFTVNGRWATSLWLILSMALFGGIAFGVMAALGRAKSN